mmetsp:Transcript_1004/g.1366  ORF Transcript_1004/g.1366 Transcript_1004/m.1366 type:complete len:243 (+) Transcript_1004:85-813(+)|eukprot:CAMPEP_0201696836 /NCGR_PEP_ID=MMETSP0578-20130828/8355_1 /ASSEMBLY_ACC=CAM_ASM_000663 /TAXON_ID=267565 /ORGANISM="Skeletonema grethea, Strain CCMP 1804" /LENGTH=242 /DNA_ID=CAMNT_0048182867 /DNA_START=30 /DNA_END=758 /DNA_ORIENTATION=-
MRNNLVLAVIATVQLCPVESFAPPAAKVRRNSSITTASLFHWGKRKSGKGDSQHDVAVDEQSSVDDESSSLLQNSRRSFLSATAASSLLPLRSTADTSSVQTDKQLNLSDEELKKIVLSDIVDKSFLVSADITRSIYDESATFTDEIDVYTMDKWVKGTKALFIASGSRVSLVGDVDVSASEVAFRFDEDLMFNIPFKPVCSLTGKVVLTRDEKTGLITSYREYWDQSVNDVLKTAKFGKKA